MYRTKGWVVFSNSSYMGELSTQKTSKSTCTIRTHWQTYIFTKHTPGMELVDWYGLSRLYTLPTTPVHPRTYFILLFLFSSFFLFFLNIVYSVVAAIAGETERESSFGNIHTPLKWFLDSQNDENEMRYRKKKDVENCAAKGPTKQNVAKERNHKIFFENGKGARRGR